MSACDIPTELPKWNTLWVVPGETTVVPIDELLPSAISVNEAGDEFLFALPSLSISTSLREVCSACGILPGIAVRKPEFTFTVADSLDLPEEVIEVEVTGGSFRFDLRHSFGFDPLRPSPSARGYLVLTAFSGGVELARDSIDGRDRAFPPNVTLTEVMQLTPAAISRPIQVELTVYSPEGDPVVIDPDQELSVTVQPNDLRLARARIRIDDDRVASESVRLDLEGVEEGITERVKAGAIRLEVGNPFDLSGEVELLVTAPSLEIVKTLEVEPGDSEVRVEFTGDELRSILSSEAVHLRIIGALATPTGGTLVTPADEITYRASLEVTIGPKEE